MSRVFRGRSAARSPRRPRFAWNELPNRLRTRLTGDSESGFTLLETIISVTILGIVMTATTSFFVTANRSTNGLRQREVAAQLADDALEKIGTYQVSTLPSILPISQNSSINNVNYTVLTSGVQCTMPRLPVDGSNADNVCTPQPAAVNVGVSNDPSIVNFEQLSTTVSWSGSSCPAAGCSFSTGRLVNISANPVFPVNPALCTTNCVLAIQQPSPHNSDVGVFDTYTLSSNGGGIGTPVWSAPNLPTGIKLDPYSGTLSGTPTQTGSTLVPVTALDSAGNPASNNSVTFTWNVYAAPVLNTPTPAQLTAVTSQPYSLTLTASQGSPGGYTYTPSNLPSWLTANAGTLSGAAPATPGRYQITVKVSDSVGGTSSALPITINVLAPPSISPVSAQSSVVNAAPNLTLTATPPSSQNVWSDPTHSLPPGLSINASTGVVSGTPITAQAAPYPVSITVTNPLNPLLTSSVSFNWTISLRRGQVPNLTGLCTNDLGAITATNSPIGGYGCTLGASNETWSFAPDGTIQAGTGTPAAPICLGINGSASGSAAVIMGCSATNKQDVWKPIASTSKPGYFTLVNQQSSGLCLNMTTNRQIAPMDAEACSSAAYPLWRLP